MKTITLIFLCLVGILAVAEYANSQQCDDYDCSADCFDKGLHGACDGYGGCACYNCIYRACRRLCIKKGLVGQCDEQTCLCL